MAQNETAWVLDTILSNWPDPLYPSDLYRINRDEPEILETGETQMEVELTRANSVGAEFGGRTRKARGTEFWYTVETTIDVRVVATAKGFGHVTDDESFRLLVNKIQRAIDDARSYPTVPTQGTTVGEIAYSTAIVQNEQAGLATAPDAMRTDFEVVLRGKQER